jgi:nucleotide-binding universal stress UspA family protein
MFRKILAPLDGSNLAEKALPYVEVLAQKFEAEIVLGWVVQLKVQTLPEHEPFPLGMAAVYTTESETQRGRAYLAAVQRGLNQRHLRCVTRVVEGYSIADAIVAIAVDEGVDLIVKTTYARLGLSRWLHGNVAAAVLQRAPCPLFLVRVSDEDGAG